MVSLQWREYRDPAVFFHQVRMVLESDEAAHNRPLSVLRHVFDHHSSLCPEPHFWSLAENKAVQLAFLRFPPADLMLCAGKDIFQARAAAGTAAKKLYEASQQFPGVEGLRPAVDYFAEQWQLQSGCETQLRMAQKIMVLETLRSVGKASGYLRDATADDLDLILPWFEQFQTETETKDSREDCRTTGAGIVRRGELKLWIDGHPRAMAGAARPGRHGVVINNVYTPPKERGRGYATALVSALAAQLRKTFRFCMLYTNAEDPLTNSLYAKIGFVSKHDAAVYRFYVPH